MSANHDHQFAPEGDPHESHPEAHVTGQVHGRHPRDHQPRKASRDAEHSHGEHRGHGGHEGHGDHVERIEGVSDVSVEIPNGRLTVHSTPTVTDEAVHAAIGQAGYTIAASA